MHVRRSQNDAVSTAIILRIPPPFSPEELIPLPFLQKELIREILLRLSVKYLVQFKCVSKLWKTLISDSQFVKSHLQISRTTTKQVVFSVLEKPYTFATYTLEPLFENRSNHVEPVTLRYMKNRNKFIIGSCNGLLCVFDSYQSTVKLWNPSIRFKSNKSPEAFSPNWPIMQYGFGYDQVNDKYKVLLVSQSLTKIYTFGENMWKTIQNISARTTTTIGKFVSGTLNWMVYGGNSNQLMVFSFDVEKETCREMLLPHGSFYMRSKNNLSVLSNCLCVWDRYNAVWLMKEYGVVESWTKVMTVPLVNNVSYFEDALFISENSVLFMRTCYYQDGANGTSSSVSRYISEEGGVTLPPISASRLVLYNSNIDRRYPLIKIPSTIGFDLHIHCESLVSLPW